MHDVAGMGEEEWCYEAAAMGGDKGREGKGGASFSGAVDTLLRSRAGVEIWCRFYHWYIGMEGKGMGGRRSRLMIMFVCFFG